MSHLACALPRALQQHATGASIPNIFVTKKERVVPDTEKRSFLVAQTKQVHVMSSRYRRSEIQTLDDVSPSRGTISLPLIVEYRATQRGSAQFPFHQIQHVNITKPSPALLPRALWHLFHTWKPRKKTNVKFKRGYLTCRVLLCQSGRTNAAT